MVVVVVGARHSSGMGSGPLGPEVQAQGWPPPWGQCPPEAAPAPLQGALCASLVGTEVACTAVLSFGRHPLAPPGALLFRELGQGTGPLGLCLSL